MFESLYRLDVTIIVSSVGLCVSQRFQVFWADRGRRGIVSAVSSLSDSSGLLNNSFVVFSIANTSSKKKMTINVTKGHIKFACRVSAVLSIKLLV